VASRKGENKEERREREREEKLRGWSVPTEHEELDIRGGGTRGQLGEGITDFQVYKKFGVGTNKK